MGSREVRPTRQSTGHIQESDAVEPNEPPLVLVVMKRLDLRGTSDPTSGVLATMRMRI
jgi:hypothetical protein